MMKGTFGFSSTNRNDLRTPISGRVSQNQRWHGELKSTLKSSQVNKYANTSTYRFSRSSRGLVDVDGLPQETIPPEGRWHGELKSLTGGKQTNSKFLSTSALPFKERPEIAPLAPQAGDRGPAAYALDRDAWRSRRGAPALARDPLEGTGVSDRSLPIVCQGELKRGRKVEGVTPAMQYPQGQDMVSLSQVRSAPALRFAARPETVPVPPRPHAGGPAQYNLQGHLALARTLGGTVRLRDRDPLRPSERALPVVCQGELKQGRMVDAVAPTQQYPAGSGPLGAESRHRRAPAAGFARREREVFPLPTQNNSVGPAGYDLPGTLNLAAGARLPKRTAEGTRPPPRAASAATFDRLSRMHDNIPRPKTLAAWLNGEAREKEKGVPLNSISDWLKAELNYAEQLEILKKIGLSTEGEPSKGLQKTFQTRRPATSGRGNVQPTFVPQASGNIRSKAGQERIIAELLNDLHAQQQLEREAAEEG